jgi:hypothetical protein
MAPMGAVGSIIAGSQESKRETVADLTLLAADIRKRMARLAGWVVLAAVPLAGQVAPPAERLKPETIDAFERYARTTESRLAGLPRGCEIFLWADAAERRRRLLQGAILSEPQNRRGDVPVASGLIHDWVGAVFIPSARVEDVMKVVRDYNRHQDFYRPEVVSSRILSNRGDEYKVRLRLLKRKVITVLLDTEHEIRYEKLGATCWQSRSASTSIREVRNPGKDHGFMWRLNSYWRFHEGDGGTYVECEVVSLSRAVPPILARLIDPIVRQLPQQSMADTLRATRAAVEKGRPKGPSGK